MLDLGLSKLAIIGVVALVVIGPERLPRVARTVGALLGRAQRYINDVKSEVSREMDMSDLKDAKSAFEAAARGAQSSVSEHLRETEDHLNDTWRSLNPDVAADSAAATGAETETSTANPSGYSVYEEGVHTPSASYSAPPAAGDKVRRRNWRIKQTSQPVWFKRSQGVRTRIQSGAARVARHRPAGGRASAQDATSRTTRFL